MIVVMAVFVKASFPIVYNSPSTLLTFCVTQVIGAYFIGAITLFIVEMPAVHIIRILLRRPTTSEKADGSEVKNTLIER
uniref:Uncharacterized protein n=1 Tax=Parascaris equorum TaxID=6256 RepID=A0A914S4L7_PAREQ